MVLVMRKNIILINLTHDTDNLVDVVNYILFIYVVIVTCYNKNIFVRCGFLFQFICFIFFTTIPRMGRMVSFSPQKFIMAQTNVKALLSVTFMDAELWLCAHYQRGRENIILVFIVKYSLCVAEYHQIGSFWSSMNNNIVPYLLHQRLLPTGFLHLFFRKGKYRNLWSVWSNQNKKGFRSIFVLIENACLRLYKCNAILSFTETHPY